MHLQNVVMFFILYSLSALSLLAIKRSMAQFCRRNASVYFKGFLDKVHTVIISNVGILHIRSSITIHQNDQSSQNVAIVPKMHVSVFLLPFA